MVELPRVVNAVRDDLKKEYIKDPAAVWQLPLVVVIKRNDVNYFSGAGMSSPEKVVRALESMLSAGEVKGIVVGRMMVKYGKTLDSEGQPTVKEKAIVVNGRMLDTKRSYISIIPLVEHRDLRAPIAGEPLKRPDIRGLESPDKIEIMKNEHGEDIGVFEASFAPEKVMDSRNGAECKLDPIVQNLSEEHEADRYDK